MMGGNPMPMRPSSLCSTPVCGGRAVRGGRCRLCLTRYEQQRGSATARGYDSEWEALRAQHLTAHPWCYTGTCRKRAFDVDHIIAVRIAPHRRLDPTNLRSYCRACHLEKHRADRVHPGGGSQSPA